VREGRVRERKELAISVTRLATYGKIVLNTRLHKRSLLVWAINWLNRLNLFSLPKTEMD